MENQDQWLQNGHFDAVVVDNLMSMFGNMISKDVILAVLESCDGDVNNAVEGIMRLNSDDSSVQDANANNLINALDDHDNGDANVVQNATEDIKNVILQSNTAIPPSIIIPPPNQSYAVASQSTGAIPKKTSSSPVSDKKMEIWTDQCLEIMKNHNQGNRILIIMRGVPGSGKSYLARKIVEQTTGSTFNHFKTHIFSTDDFFMVKNKYCFNRYQLPEAHLWNQNRVRVATMQGVSPIIVDNTNVEAWEMLPYLRDGISNGYIIEVMLPNTPWAKKANQLARKNVHGTPFASIKRMLENFEYGLTGESLRIRFNLLYPPSMVPPVKRNVPVIENIFLLPTTDSAQVVQAMESNGVVTMRHDDSYKNSPIVAQLPSDSNSHQNKGASSDSADKIDISGNAEIMPKHIEFETHEKETDNCNETEADIAEGRNQHQLYLETQRQLEQLQNFELAWESGENWDETQELEKVEHKSLNHIDPKPQRKNPEANLSSTAISQEASSNILLDSITQCEDWRQISMFMPPWHVGSLPNSRQLADMPVAKRAASTCMEIGDTDDSGSKLKIISAVPRDINEFYVSHEKEKIPEKRMLDKSSMTTDHEITEMVRCKNEEKHFVAFRKLFKNIPRTSLRDIFDNCRGDVNWAVGIVFDGMANNQLPAGNSEEMSDHEDEVVEECSCVSHYHVIPNVECSTASIMNEQIASNSETVFQPRRKPKKDIPSDISMQLKRQIEQNVAISASHYSEHCLKIRKMRRGEYSKEDEDHSDKGSPAIVTPGAASNLHQELEKSDDEESNVSEEETVNINLGPEFVAQLDKMFSRADTVYPSSINYTISIRASIMDEINALWMESVMNQVDECSHQSAVMLEQDEEFARELALKEHELAQAGLEPAVPDFKEIMDLDLALSLYRKDVAEWRNNEPMDLAAKLTRDKLYNLFPEVSPEVLSELLMAHDNNFEVTVEALLVSTGKSGILQEKNGVNKFIVQKEFERQQKILNEEQKALSEVEWPLLSKAEHVGMATVDGYREEAEQHLVRRNRYYNKAQDYIRRGMIVPGRLCSDVANLHKKKYEQANSLAVASLVQLHASKCDNATIDLHYFRVAEAKEALDLFLDTHIQQLREIQQRGGVRCRALFFITGRGLHSPGLPRVKPAVRKRLIERGLTCSERNPGLLTARVCAEDKLTYQVP